MGRFVLTGSQNFALMAHHRNLGKRVVKMPKLYFHDAGPDSYVREDMKMRRWQDTTDRIEVPSRQG